MSRILAVKILLLSYSFSVLFPPLLISCSSAAKQCCCSRSVDQKGGSQWSAIREVVSTTTQPNSSLMTFGRCCGDCIKLHSILSSCAFERNTSACNRCATSALPAARSHALTHFGSSSTLQQLHGQKQNEMTTLWS